MKTNILFVLLFIFSSCGTYDQYKYYAQELEIPSQIFDADFNQTWLAVLQTVRKFEISQQNQEGGIIKTRWMENTQEVNFSDSFGTDDVIKGAKFHMTINVAKGYRYGREVTKVSILKRQLIEQDFLQGWKEVTTDQVQEKTLLYRIGRVLEIDKKIRDIDKAKQEEQEKKLL